MRQNSLFLFFFLLVSFSVAAQDASEKNFSVEASYPKSINDGFLGDGVIDLGLKYRFADLKAIKLGVGINGSLFTDNDEDNASGNPTKTKNYFIQPRIFGEFTIKGAEKLKPSIGIGYSFVNSKIEGISRIVGDYKYTFDNNGFDLNLGTSYDITKSFFAQIQYDLIFLGDNNGAYRINEFSTLKLGVGFRF